MEVSQINFWAFFHFHPILALLFTVSVELTATLIAEAVATRYYNARKND